MFNRLYVQSKWILACRYFRQLSNLGKVSSIKYTDSCSHSRCKKHIESRAGSRLNRGLSTKYHVVVLRIDKVNREYFAYLPQLRCELRLRIAISNCISISISISISCSISIGRLDSSDNWWLWVSGKCRERVICIALPRLPLFAGEEGGREGNVS